MYLHVSGKVQALLLHKHQYCDIVRPMLQGGSVIWCVRCVYIYVHDVYVSNITCFIANSICDFKMTDMLSVVFGIKELNTFHKVFSVIFFQKHKSPYSLY